MRNETKKQAKPEVAVTRNYRDKLFRMIFKEKEELLSLFNAINGTEYDNPEELEINTLEGALYLGMKNDLSCVIDMMMQLYEHQTTVNPNMPLRDLFYVSDLLQKWLQERRMDIYSSKQILIPTPKFVIFYNGDRAQPERMEMRLSDAFSVDTGEINLEVVVLMINLNRGYNEQLKKTCQTLGEYTEFTERVREYRKTLVLQESVKQAIEDCIRDGILRDFLIKNKAEVMSMCLYEFDEELHEQTLREEGRAEGREEGRAEGREEGREEILLQLVAVKLKRGKSISQIAEEFEIPEKTIREMVEKVKTAMV